MQELVIFLSSIAGVCTAAAVKKFPKNKAGLMSLGANSQIKNQINSLSIEKEILTKTITRLYQNDVDLGKIQRDRLLSRYQHQLGIILAKIEKLDAASKHPDLGPIGEGLITLMDQKLSQLDNRLYELSSKITVANSHIQEVEEQKPKEENKKEIKKEKSEPQLQEKQIEIEKIKEKPQPQIVAPAVQYNVPLPKSVELTTLTEISNIPSEFPFIEQKSIPPKNAIIDEILKPEDETPEKIEIIQAPFNQKVIPETPNQEIIPEQTQSINASQIEQSKPKPTVNLPAEEKIEEEDDDLDRIKGEIRKALSKLDQAEVE